jgi:protein TonB
MTRTPSEGARLAAILSLAAHLALAAICVVMLRLGPDAAPAQASNDRPRQSIIWRVVPGPGGGGGGGGDRSRQPARRAELVGKDRATVTAKPRETPADTTVDNPPVALPTIDAVPLANANQPLPGSITSQLTTGSRGPGDGGGADTGKGPGDGAGTGRGSGPGGPDGTGGGPYLPGNGVTVPVLIRDVKPQYTADAMRAKVQGSVWLECVVLPDGSVGDVRVTRSLDQRFGLDEEAIKAATQWRFRPGMRMGEPVAVVVTIELTFNLR